MSHGRGCPLSLLIYRKIQGLELYIVEIIILTLSTFDGAESHFVPMGCPLLIFHQSLKNLLHLF